MKTVQLTAAQAMVRYLAAQMAGEGKPFLARRCRAIFGHGNVAGLGEALRESFPTYRGHNEQTMAHSAIAYAKRPGRAHAMMVTSSNGPGVSAGGGFRRWHVQRSDQGGGNLAGHQGLGIRPLMAGSGG